MKCYEAFEEKLGSAFARYGRFVARHPWKIIIGMVLVNGLLGIGMLRLESDIDVNRVYAPTTSQATKDEEKVQNIFPDKSGESFYGYQLTITALSARVLFKPYNGTILDTAFLDKVQDLVDAIQNIAINHNGSPVKFDGICARNRNSCVVDGDIFLSPEFRTALTSSNVEYPEFLRSTGEPVDLSSLVAGAEVTSGKLTKARFMYIQFNLRSDSDEFKEESKKWQEEFIEFMKNFRSDSFDFAFAHSDSLSQELNANINGDIGLFSVTFTLMITYACIATFSASNNCIGNRMFLGFAGVMAAGLGIVASFGLVSACGMKFVSIVGNSPFLLLGIGVDAMFIMLSGLADADYAADTGDRIGQMMRTSGVAITITSFTDILAFASGVTSSFKSVRNFCVFTGVAVIFTYINQMTFFTACVAANEGRMKSKRHVFLFCKTTKSKKEFQDENASKTTIFCCAGRTPKNRDDVESLFERLPRKYLPKIVLQLPVKIIILFLFAGYVGLSAWGISGLEQGLVTRNLVAEDSYFLKYTEWSEDNFEARIPISFVIESHVDYSSSKIQSGVKDMLDRAEGNRFISDNSRISWLEEFGSSAYYKNASEAIFVQSLRDSFLKDSRYTRFENDVKIVGDTITSSRVYVFTVTVVNSQDNGQMMLDMRDVASATASPLSVTAFSPVFIIYEQYVAILPQTLQTLGVSLAAVFLITAIFMPHPLLLLYVMITMAMIMSGIIGFMHHWGLTLSSITMIHLIMSVGFSVDFTAHICHAFMVANGKNRNERVKVALESSGGPILNGAISSVLGIVMLSIAKSYIFKSFFQVMLLVVLFGVGHAVLFLPTILSFIGPAKTNSETFTRKTSINNSNNKVSPNTSEQNLRNSVVEMKDKSAASKESSHHNKRYAYDNQSLVNGDQGVVSHRDKINEKLASKEDVTVIYTGKEIKTLESVPRAN